jgi:hypothetical protein
MSDGRAPQSPHHQMHSRTATSSPLAGIGTQGSAGFWNKTQHEGRVVSHELLQPRLTPPALEHSLSSLGAEITTSERAWVHG